MDPNRLNGKNILITGAARGMGAANAEAFAAQGANVCIGDLDWTVLGRALGCGLHGEPRLVLELACEFVVDELRHGRCSSFVSGAFSRRGGAPLVRCDHLLAVLVASFGVRHNRRARQGLEVADELELLH